MICMHYKSIKYIIAVLFFIFSTMGLFADEKFSIAVMDLQVTNVKKDEVDLLIDFLNHSLFQTGIFDVIQKDKRDRLLKEIEFSTSDVADQKKTKEIGKLLSAKLLIFGSVGKLGSNIIFNISVLDVETGSTVSTHSKTYAKLEDIVEDLPKISDTIANAAMQTMFIKKARVIYYDNFSTKNWTVSEYLFYKNEKYNIYNKELDWWVCDITMADDFALEIEAQWMKGVESMGYGTLFRVQDINNYYLFVITKDGYYKVDKVVDGSYKQLTSWERSTAINDKGVNYLKVVAVGKHLTFYVNNIKVKEMFDSTFSKGYYGMFSGGGVHAAFDNLVVYQGNLLFYEDFSKQGEHFITAEQLSYSKGEYLVDGADSFCYSWTEVEYENISFRADARWVSGPLESGYGLSFRVKDVNNHYLFIILKSGYYRFGYYKDGEWNVLIDWTRSRLINPEGKNVLRVESVDALHKLYINDNRVGECEDDTFDKGVIGFFSAAEIVAAFDNAEVFKLDQ
jgi:TolB-like protein